MTVYYSNRTSLMILLFELRASRANDGQPCEALPAYTSGGSSLARLLKFQDGTGWIARVQLRKSTPETLRKLQTEIDTMALLRSRMTLVPRVFAFELDDAQPAGAAFVQITSVRLPQIGTVVHDADASFTTRPIPGIGGPFNTATSFMQAWAAKIRFPYNEDYIRKCMPLSLVGEILKGMNDLPGRLARLAASDKYFKLQGLFPIRHADLFHSNVIVNKAFEVLGVIDWEGACTVPWELSDAPCFLKTVPRLLNLPGKYSESGLPLDRDEAGRWADEGANSVMVREAEQSAHVDHKLSQALANRDAQDLAGILYLFTQGKMGFYGKALDYFENK
ncbi:kinase-like domain-containing protein [Nemania sp. FL0031]|nr:kinase-like domain-containing protein [Nemania sp. FL0031]